jgi:lipopolysaccharide/colanic/teichoic acid biosynthesis glycosyltransferase
MVVVVIVIVVVVIMVMVVIVIVPTRRSAVLAFEFRRYGERGSRER